MSTDGGLRAMFRDYFKEAHWQPIEAAAMGQGIPDVEYCFPPGLTGWIENKKCSGGFRLDHPPSPHQIGWLERRARAGGRAFVAVRRTILAGPRRGPAVDELWLFRGTAARNLLTSGLRGAEPLGVWEGGLKGWRWQEIKAFLTA